MILGTVTAVEARDLGSELVADVAAGAKVLPLDFVTDFDEDGGSLILNGVTYTYVSADPDAETVTLASGLTSDASLGDVASAVDASASSVEWLAHVALDEGDTVTAVIPTSLIGFLPEGSYAQPVAVELDVVDDRYRVASQPERPPSLDGQVVYNPHATRVPPTMNVQPSTWTQLMPWTDVEVDGIQADPGGVTILTAGYYAYTVRIPFSADPTGKRRLRLMLNGVQIGFDSTSADDQTFSAVSISDARRFAELDVLTVEVSHTASSDLLLAATAAPSWSIYRVSV